MFFPPNRGPEAALLCQLWPHTPDDPHTLHQPLLGPYHHLHHLHQRYHNVLRALQSTSRKKKYLCVQRYVCIWCLCGRVKAHIMSHLRSAAGIAPAIQVSFVVFQL